MPVSKIPLARYLGPLVFFSLREYRPYVKAPLIFLLRHSHLLRNSNCLDLQQANISSSPDESAIFTPPRSKVTDVSATHDKFSSYAGKGQRRRWSVHTSESGQRKSSTAATVLLSAAAAAGVHRDK